MKKQLLACFTIIAMSAAPAMAQGSFDVPTASPQAKKSARSSDRMVAAKPITPLAAQALYNFAGCIVGTNRKGVAKLLSRDFRTKEYSDEVRRMAKGHTRCVHNSRLGFSQVLFVGDLAEHLLVDTYSDTALTANLALDRSANPIAARSDREMTAMCVVMRAPKESAALFRTEVMSDAEKTVLAAVAPQLATCVKKGKQFRTNRSGLRALLALAAYRVVETSSEESAG